MDSNPGDAVEIAIVGAGVVGLAIARRFAMKRLSVFVLERALSFGTETSSRNSEVIHAGIYYQPGSLKARLCIAGNRLLYDFCKANSVNHRNCGKLVVAANQAQLGELTALHDNAARSGVTDLEIIDRRQALSLEPEIDCVGALFSPSSGIVDAHEFMLALIGEAEAHGAQIVYRTNVQAIDSQDDCWTISIEGETGPALRARTVINCAGLHATKLAASIEGFSADKIPHIRFAKGCYFSYASRTKFRHLVYPVPDSGGLGIHLTLDLAGAARFGPDVEWIDTIDYSVDEERRESFGASIARYWPAFDIAKLQPAYAGIRPKLTGPGETPADFRVETAEDHGVAGVINLFGIESPGLTASLAIADHVYERWAAME